jgi:hypothetical protein
MHGFVGCSMRVAGKVQVTTSFGDDGHVDKALRVTRGSVKHFSVGPGKKELNSEIVTMEFSPKDIRFGRIREG